jgi:NAD(P)-dependent dehydrogenase (short-subunit alcohol dehydrogenase family)
VRGAPGLSDYVAARHGVIGLTKSAALEYASRGIRVNVIAPGPVVNGRIASLTDEQRQPIRNAVPMKPIGLPKDVAAASLWLCAPESSYLTGAVINLDGGQTSGPFGF